MATSSSARTRGENAASSPLPTGCERHGPDLRFTGPRGRKRIAIGFDDGPAPGTGGFLRAIKRLEIHATFFEIGGQVPGNATVMKRILAAGNEIGNHSTHHTEYPGEGDLRETQRLIEGATGFTPCVFRPPDGAFNGATVAGAARADLQTIMWDVDPQDWRTPGPGAIRANVVGHAHPGAIVVMHDGGGPRGGTLAALPGIVHALHHRGYELVTVSELLGNELIYPEEEDPGVPVVPTPGQGAQPGNVPAP